MFKFNAWSRKRIPDRTKNFTHTSACLYSSSEDGDFKYKTELDGVHYCYELGGSGFKYMPIHGKIIHEALILEKDRYFAVPSTAKL